MKRVLLFSLFTGLVLFMSACGHTHSYGQWATAVEAGCLENGTEERTCSCGEAERRTIPATGHSVGEWIIDKEETCTENGQKHNICSNCNATVDEATIPAAGHAVSEWITDLAATCTEDGAAHTVCTTCNITLEEKVLPAGHTESDWIIDKEPTCTALGKKHTVCTLCNKTVLKQDIEALGHKWVDATCKEAKTCSVCGIKEGTALGHEGDDLICTRCGKSTFETLYFSGTGNKILYNVHLPEASYKVTLKNKTGRFTIFTYFYQKGDGSWTNYMTAGKGLTEEKIFTMAFDGYIEVESIDDGAQWSLTIELFE